MTWAHTATRADAISTADPPSPPLRWEYDQALLVSLTLTVDDFQSFVANLVSKGQFFLPQVDPLSLQGRFALAQYISSNSPEYGLVWPSDRYQFHCDPRGHLSGGRLFSQIHPVFIDSSSLMQEHVHLDPERHVGDVHILLPNYAARINRVRLGSKSFTVTVEAGGIPDTDLLVKFHAIDPQGNLAHHDELVPNPNEVIAATGFRPSRLYVALLSRASGELLDFRDFRGPGWPASEASDDVIVEHSTEEELEALLLQGEGSQLEFKLKPGSGTELAETVVAFENTAGGIILIGVDPSGNVAGCDADQENTVRNLLRANCDQALTPDVVDSQLRGKRVLMIRVPEGDTKPYTVRGKGVMVRAGSTDRAAMREELDAFYASRNVQLLPGPTTLRRRR